MSSNFKHQGPVVQGLTLSTLWTSTNTYANSVEPDEAAQNEPLHLALHCLPFYLMIFDYNPQWTTMNVSTSKDGRVHFRNSGVKDLKTGAFHFSTGLDDQYRKKATHEYVLK